VLERVVGTAAGAVRAGRVRLATTSPKITGEEGCAKQLRRDVKVNAACGFAMDKRETASGVTKLASSADFEVTS
jgi:hypothetical protein